MYGVYNKYMVCEQCMHVMYAVCVMCLWCVCVCGMPMCGVYMWGVLVYMVCVLCRVYGICIDMFLYVSHRLFITVMKHHDQSMLGRKVLI